MIKSEIKLEIDTYYSKHEIKDLNLIPCNGHQMDYLTYEKNSRIYFFERIDKNLLRLFCCTSKKSFYLKKSIS
jgi:hypothetical protein